jgi:hypothetical protein
MGEPTLDEIISMSELMADDPIAFFRTLGMIEEAEKEAEEVD